MKNAVATAMYVGAGYGPGPRDGLMTGLAARGYTIRRARTAIEIGVLAAGWGLTRFNSWYYERDPGWRGFYEHNFLRGRFTDYLPVAYNERTRPALEAVGWSEKTYPFPEDTTTAGGLEPLLLPWSEAGARRYKWSGSAFVAD